MDTQTILVRIFRASCILLFAVMIFGALTGCSTLAQIGEIEGSGKVGEYLRAIESTRVVMGGRPHNRDVAAVVNRTMGEANALSESLGSTTTTNLPQRIERFGYIIENVTYEK